MMSGNVVLGVPSSQNSIASARFLACWQELLEMRLLQGGQLPPAAATQLQLNICNCS